MGLHSRDRGPPHLLRHALRVVAAARGQRARRRCGSRAPEARTRGHRAPTVVARARPACRPAPFSSTERLGCPARRSGRERLRIRVDALLATSDETAAAAADRFDGDYKLVPLGVDTTLFRPGRKRRLIALELEAAGRPVTRAVIRLLGELPGWELNLLHTKPLGVRPTISRSLRARVHVRSARREEHRAAILAEAAIFVPAPSGEQRLE